MPSEPQMLGDETDADSRGYATDSAGTRSAILGYFLILFLAVGLGTPIGIAAIPISYYLKDNLHLSPVQLAVFVVIAGTPAYFGFLPGFVRDRFRPRLMGDRFYLLVGATVALAAYVYLGIASITYLRLLYATVVAGIAYLIILSGSQALMTGVAQGHLMTGRLSVVSGVSTYVPADVTA
jgi:choline-glycine betaine transporter